MPRRRWSEISWAWFTRLKCQRRMWKGCQRSSGVLRRFSRMDYSTTTQRNSWKYCELDHRKYKDINQTHHFLIMGCTPSKTQPPPLTPSSPILLPKPPPRSPKQQLVFYEKNIEYSVQKGDPQKVLFWAQKRHALTKLFPELIRNEKNENSQHSSAEEAPEENKES